MEECSDVDLNRSDSRRSRSHRTYEMRRRRRSRGGSRPFMRRRARSRSLFTRRDTYYHPQSPSGSPGPSTSGSSRRRSRGDSKERTSGGLRQRTSESPHRRSGARHSRESQQSSGSGRHRSRGALHGRPSRWDSNASPQPGCSKTYSVVVKRQRRSRTRSGSSNRRRRSFSRSVSPDQRQARGYTPGISPHRPGPSGRTNPRANKSPSKSGRQRSRSTSRRTETARDRRRRRSPTTSRSSSSTSSTSTSSSSSSQSEKSRRNKSPSDRSRSDKSQNDNSRGEDRAPPKRSRRERSETRRSPGNRSNQGLGGGNTRGHKRHSTHGHVSMLRRGQETSQQSRDFFYSPQARKYPTKRSSKRRIKPRVSNNQNRNNSMRRQPLLPRIAHHGIGDLLSILEEEFSVKLCLKRLFEGGTYEELLNNMFDIRADTMDDIIEYYFDKKYALKCCRISGQDASDCMLFGISAEAVRDAAAVVGMTPRKLLSHFRTAPIESYPSIAFFISTGTYK